MGLGEEGLGWDGSLICLGIFCVCARFCYLFLHCLETSLGIWRKFQTKDALSTLFVPLVASNFSQPTSLSLYKVAYNVATRSRYQKVAATSSTSYQR